MKAATVVKERGNKNYAFVNLQRHNLLHIGWLKSMVVSKWFPGSIQFIFLIAFIILAIIGFYGTTNDYRYFNMASFSIWVVWWPGLVFLALFSARSWCTVCPLRYVTQKAERFGLQLRVPKIIRKNKLLIVLGLFVLHTVIVSYHVHHVSMLTSIYLFSLLGFAFLIALICEKNSFCNSFCPLNGFIGVYSSMSSITLASSDTAICRKCTDNNCFNSCPSQLHMGSIASSEDCLLCFECVKKCKKDNIQLVFAKPFQSLGEKRPSIPLMLLITILLGIMIEEVGEEWVVIEELTTFVPNFLTSIGVPNMIYGYHWLDALWLTLLLPLSIVFLTASLAALLTGQRKVIEFASTYIWGLVPLIFSLHFSKMLHKVNTKFGYSQYVLQDPYGQKSVDQIAAGAVFSPGNVFFSKSIEGALLFGIIASGLVVSLMVILKLAKSFESEFVGTGSAVVFSTTTILLGIISLFININWFGLI